MTRWTLGIETSCDETAAAVVSDSGEVASNVVESQVTLHAPYGGVVPELASRDHLRNARPVVEAAMQQAGCDFGELSGIAVTVRPGLTGALHVGAQFAQGLGFARDLPVVGVDHLMGHLCAPFLHRPGEPKPEAKLPFLALLVSGGHTALYRVDALREGAIQELGATRDDAAGEAFDKVAKLLGLGYPGGPVIDRLAREGDASRFELPLPMPNKASLEFSFSGLKTNVARWVERHGPLGDNRELRDLCAAFQRAVVETLVRKSMVAASREDLRTLVIGGGVAANRELRERAAAAGAERGVAVVVPPFAYCTDNAAMIAFAGSARLAAGEDDRASLAVSPRTLLPRATRKGRGRRGADAVG